MKVFKGIRQFSSNSRKEKTLMIPFYDDKIAVIQEISAVKHTRLLVPLRQFCDALNIRWDSQYRRIKAVCFTAEISLERAAVSL